MRPVARRFILIPGVAWCCLASTFIGAEASVAADAGQTGGGGVEGLAPEEIAAGWRLLFDGRSTQGWRGFRKSTFPDRGWIIQDGMIRKVAGVRGGDLITIEKFGNFELSWEWRIGAGGNNGVKYFIVEESGSAVGHEYQMIDDSGVRNSKGSTASFYDVLPPKANKPPPRIDEWNQSRIVVRGDRVEHWLNGEKVLDYQLGSREVLNAVARSKFKGIQGFGTKVDGHILLTDHTDEAWFRRIMIRTPRD